MFKLFFSQLESTDFFHSLPTPCQSEGAILDYVFLEAIRESLSLGLGVGGNIRVSRRIGFNLKIIRNFSKLLNLLISVKIHIRL